MVLPLSGQNRASNLATPSDQFVTFDFFRSSSRKYRLACPCYSCPYQAGSVKSNSVGQTVGANSRPTRELESSRAFFYSERSSLSPYAKSVDGDRRAVGIGQPLRNTDRDSKWPTTRDGRFQVSSSGNKALSGSSQGAMLRLSARKEPTWSLSGSCGCARARRLQEFAASRRRVRA